MRLRHRRVVFDSITKLPLCLEHKTLAEHLFSALAMKAGVRFGIGMRQTVFVGATHLPLELPERGFVVVRFHTLERQARVFRDRSSRRDFKQRLSLLVG